MRKKQIIIAVIIVLGVFLGWKFLQSKDGESPNNSIFSFIKSENGSKLYLNGKTINLEIADTDEKQELGLSGRDSLPEDQAMRPRLLRSRRRRWPNFLPRNADS